MNVFAVIAISPESIPTIESALNEKFAGKFIQAGDRLWFASGDTGTTFSFSEKLGVKSRAAGHITHIIVLPVTSYWGHADPAIWEWLKNTLEATV